MLSEYRNCIRHASNANYDAVKKKEINHQRRKVDSSRASSEPLQHAGACLSQGDVPRVITTLQCSESSAAFPRDLGVHLYIYIYSLQLTTAKVRGKVLYLGPTTSNPNLGRDSLCICDCDGIRRPEVERRATRCCCCCASCVYIYEYIQPRRSRGDAPWLDCAARRGRERERVMAGCIWDYYI